MSEAKTQLDTGNLSGAVEAALQTVKNNPTDAAARTFLFELSCFSGDWERAERQLDVIGHQSANAMIGSQIYRQNFYAERERIELFSKGKRPEFVMPAPDYVEELYAANNLVREGKNSEARELLDKIEEERPAFACKLNGVEKEDFRDYNDLTMCVFEAIIKEAYVWLPIEQIIKIEFFEKKTLRDVFWQQAKVEVKNGLIAEIFLPSLYVNSWKSDDDAVRLGRANNWIDAGDDLYIGEGLRMFFSNGEAVPILDINEIEFS
ncbi:MAG: type VI secretion system accessory protein TagJ [Pyrinomonadaceae bacterium]